MTPLEKSCILNSKREGYKEIDLPAYFGRFEFTVVPRSMFRQDGSLLLGTDKATVTHEIEKMIPGNYPIIKNVDFCFYLL